MSDDCTTLSGERHMSSAIDVADDLIPFGEAALEAGHHPAKFYWAAIHLELGHELRRIGRTNFIRRSVAATVASHLAAQAAATVTVGPDTPADDLDAAHRE